MFAKLSPAPRRFRFRPVQDKKLIEELAGPWAAQQESRLRERRGHARLRAEGAGPAHELPFTDRVIATLVVLRFQLPHAALALFYGMDRPLHHHPRRARDPAAAGGPWPRRAWPARAPAAHPGRRIRLRRVPGRPPAHRRHRGAGPPTPGQPARTPRVRVREEEADLLHHYPRVSADVDSGYQGLARDFPGQVTAPPAKPKTGATPSQVTEREAARKQQSSRRICVEHAIAEPRQWRTMQRYIGRRQYFADTALAIAGLVSDRTAEH